MEVGIVVDVKKAYCNADDAYESFYQLNYCDVEKLDDERVKLVFNDEQLKRVYEEYKSLDSFITEVLSKITEATEQYIYNLNISELVDYDDINVEFSDDDINKILNDEHELFKINTSDYYIDDNEVVIEFFSDDASINDAYFVDAIMHALEDELSARNYNVERIEKLDSADAVLVRI